MGDFFNVRPSGAAIAATATHVQAHHVKTELPFDRTVVAAPPAQEMRNDPQSDGERLSRQLVIDRAAAEIVYVVTDTNSKVIVAQYPDESRLRTRAYQRALDLAKQDHITRFQDRKV